MHTRILAGAATTLLVLAVCTSGAGTVDSRPDPEASDTTETGTATQQIRVTRDTDRGPEACHPPQVGETVIGLFDAINRGDAEAAIHYVSPRFAWYSVGVFPRKQGSRQFTARKLDDLVRHFRESHEHDERLYLMEIDVAYERARNLGHVSYIVRRTADDLGPNGSFAHGKGAIDCEEGKIHVWSMAQAKDILRGIPRICPGKPDPPKIGIVCARR